MLKYSHRYLKQENGLKKIYPFNLRSGYYLFLYRAIILMGMCIFSCSTKQSPDVKLISQQVRAVLNEQVKHWNNGNIEKYMQGYFRSDSLRFASGGTITYGWNATLNRYMKRYPDRAHMGKLSFTILGINILSHEAALVFGRWELELDKEDPPWGLFTLHFQKFPEGWRIVSDHTSSGNQ